jgi:hypothetical protein
MLLGGCSTEPPLPRAPEAPGDYVSLITPRPTDEPTPEPTAPPEATPEPTPVGYQPPEGAFVPEDLEVMGVTMASDYDAIVRALGEAKSEFDETEETTGTRYVTMDYDGLYIDMVGASVGSNLTLSSVTITGDAWPGPRDVRVGTPLNDVLAAFGLEAPASPEEGEEESTDPVLFYADEQADGRALPPSAELSRDANENGAYVLRMLAPLRPYEDDEKEPGMHFALRHAGLTFYFDAETDNLVRIHWFIGSLAA